MTASRSDSAPETIELLKWGLIGCGDIARKRVAPALRDLPGSELVAVSRARADLAESFAKEFGAQRWYDDWRELLADDEVDAVYIATPVYLHAEQAIAAAQAGKHVLCEKPMALTPAEAERMIQTCEDNLVLLGIAYYRRFYPLVKRLKALVEAGEVGDLVMVQANAFSRFDPEPGHPRHWLLEKKKSGGGPMRDFGCHRIELMMHLFGPIGHTASHATKAALSRQVEDTAIAVFEFERGGCGVLAVTHASAEERDTLEIFGTKGSLYVPELNGSELHIRTNSSRHTENHPPPDNLHAPLIADFIDAVSTGRRPEVDAAIGKEVDMILDAIYREADQHELRLG